jgi:RHS repeat-associated protein
VNSPSNMGHGNTDLSTWSPGSDARTCLWYNFQSVSGQVQSITLKFDWVSHGFARAEGYIEGDIAQAMAGYAVEYSLNGGGSWQFAALRTVMAFANGEWSEQFDAYSPNYPATTPVSISIPSNTPINQIRVRARLDVSLSLSGFAFGVAEVTGNRVENIKLEVVTDTTGPVTSNVVAGSITASSATITWNTNENSDSQVEYRTNTGSWQMTPLNSSLVTAHSQVLSGLTGGTGYYYRVKSKDAAGNLTVSGDLTFTTGSVAISNVAVVGITTSGATINWTTNYNSDSQVEYGLTTGYGQLAPVTPNPAPVTAHSQALSGLTSDTEYHYQIRSKDSAGNLAVSGDLTFRTGSLVISNVAAGGVTTSGATITWTTNANSDSQVEYGVDTGYGLSAPTTPNPTLVTAHSQSLSGLTAGTVYHYRVKSRDAGGKIAVSGDFTFATTSSGSIPLDGLASLSYNGANNRINTSGFEYDPAGNQTRAVINAIGTQQQYRYDCAGRLAQVLDGSGNVLATYSYGAGNQRLMSVEGGVTKYFAWAGGNIISEYEAWGTNALIWKKSYVYLGVRLLATTSGADGMETQFHHPDRLGTRLVTGAGGTVVTEQLGMPFGTMLPFTQTYGGENSYQHPTMSNPSKKRFTSYDRSDVTGLDYAVNRSYSPQQGRFTQVDPIDMDAASLSDPQTLNMYAYCGNDPINRDDPKGLFWGGIGKFFKAIGKAVATFFGSGMGGFSGPDFRTPPTFPGSLPGITAAARSGMGSFRTPPFVGGFLASGFAKLDNIGLSTWQVAVGALSLFLQTIGKVLISGNLLTKYNAARKRLDTILRDPKSPCATFLRSKKIDPIKVADVLQKQTPYDASQSTNDAADLRDLYQGYSVQSMFQTYKWRGITAQGSRDVYYDPTGVREETILHETIHQTIGPITDPDLRKKLGISKAANDKAVKSGNYYLIDDVLGQKGCK